VNIIVIGNGGREHAIARSLLLSTKVDRVWCLPGNGGTATLDRCENVDIGVDDFDRIGDFALNNKVDLVVVGPEVPLSLGIVDYLQAKHIAVFGPNQAGARIEGSKSWAKEIMVAAGVPTAKSATFTAAAPAREYIQQQGAPIVIKADGLAAGKGVVVAMTAAEALAAVDELFGANFQHLVIEEFLIGQELSVLAITDGQTIRPLLPAQDHKRIGDGDTGANTGGMGAYAPAPLGTPELMARVQTQVLEPTLAALRARGIDYRGILYAGLMISPTSDIGVLEFNCRFGDPETQAILPLLATPLIDVILACTHGQLDSLPPLAWKSEVAVCVVVAAGGYPAAYERGREITGCDRVQDAIVFHAGTKSMAGKILTDGGRVLGVTATATDFPQAIDRAYTAVKSLNFDGIYYRTDIARRSLS
jgi:phosphoribosylamine---glycine ligase